MPVSLSISPANSGAAGFPAGATAGSGATAGTLSGADSSAVGSSASFAETSRTGEVLAKAGRSELRPPLAGVVDWGVSDADFSDWATASGWTEALAAEGFSDVSVIEIEVEGGGSGDFSAVRVIPGEAHPPIQITASQTATPSHAIRRMRSLSFPAERPVPRWGYRPQVENTDGLL